MNSSAPVSQARGLGVSKESILPAVMMLAACVQIAEKLKSSICRGLTASLNFCQSRDGTRGNNSLHNQSNNITKGIAALSPEKDCLLGHDKDICFIRALTPIPVNRPVIFQNTSASAADWVGSHICRICRISEKIRLMTPSDNKASILFREWIIRSPAMPSGRNSAILPSMSPIDVIHSKFIKNYSNTPKTILMKFPK